MVFMLVRFKNIWSQLSTLEVLVSAWCIVAAWVIISAFNFYYHHPAEFRKCGGPCPVPIVSPCLVRE
jgi:hypothetical protein